jgi:hypothetical protein
LDDIFTGGIGRVAFANLTVPAALANAQEDTGWSLAEAE